MKRIADNVQTSESLRDGRSVPTRLLASMLEAGVKVIVSRCLSVWMQVRFWLQKNMHCGSGTG